MQNLLFEGDVYILDIAELIDFLFEFIEDIEEYGFGGAITMLCASFFLAGLFLLIMRKIHGASILQETKLLLVVVITGIISIGGSIMYYDSSDIVDKSETVLMYGVSIEYNESENYYELIGHSLPNRELHRLKIDEELVKTIDTNETSFTVTYEGAKNPYVTRITPVPKVEDFTTPTS